MANQDHPTPSEPQPDNRRGNWPRLSRPRLVMGALLIVAVPIFIGLANKAVRENAEAIRQSFGR